MPVKAASLILLAALATAATAHAQTTWRGLRFGDTREAVRSQLSAQNIEVVASQEGSLQSTSDYQLVLPGLTRALPFRLDFRFTDAGGLMDVTLWLDLTAMRQNYSEYRTDDAMLAFASERLSRALNDIYNAPMTESSGCDADAAAFAKGPVECDAHWHAHGQSVALIWHSRPATMFIRYQMLPADL